MKKNYENYGTTDGLDRCLKCKYFDKKNVDCTYDGIYVGLDEKKERLQGSEYTIKEDISGIELIKSGKCPLGKILPATCMFCSFGHLTECHYPYTCDSDMCHHYDNIEED